MWISRCLGVTENQAYGDMPEMQNHFADVKSITNLDFDFPKLNLIVLMFYFTTLIIKQRVMTRT